MTKAAFNQSDINGDDVINAQEAGEAIRNELAATLATFFACDQNYDAAVSSEEAISCFIKRFGDTEETLEAAENLINDSDTDGNGKIDFNEAEARLLTFGMDN